MVGEHQRGGVGARAALVVLVLLLGALGCTSPEASRSAPDGTPPPRRGGELVFGTSGEVNGFNPIVSQWSGPAYVIGRAVLDPLVVMDREGNWQPYLARSFTPNEDFTEWTIELRPGIEFHNGEVLDAEALALFLEAATTSPLSSQGFPEQPEITVVDELAVRLTFREPWSAMPVALAEQPGYVIAPEQVRSGDTQHPIGTGPFVFEEWVPDSLVRVSRNPSYWQEGLPYLDGIEFRPLADQDARVDSLRSGAVDTVELYHPGRLLSDELDAAGFTLVGDVDRVGSAIVLMNNDAGPLGDLDVRRAVVAAIGREAYRDTVLDDSVELADQPFPEGSRWHADVDYPAFDPELARRLVEEHEATDGPVQLRMMTVAGGPLDGPLFVQQALEAVGIEVEIEELELVGFVQRLVGGDFEMVLLGSFFGAADPDGSYPFISSSGASGEKLVQLNFARYRDDEVDRALEAQRRTDDLATRQEAWATVWRAFAADLPYAFLNHDSYVVATSPEVFGLDAPTTPEGAALPALNHWTPFLTWAYRSP